MPNFDDWMLKDAQEAVAAAMQARITPADYEANRKFVEDRDHWQDGDGWVGPTGGTALRSRVLAAVKPQFTPADVINEVLGRFVNALVKTEPVVTFAPVASEELSEQEQAEIEGMLSALSGWWDTVKLWEAVRTAVKRSRWGGKGSLRVYIPNAKLVDGKAADGSDTRVLPTGLTFADALSRLRLSTEEPRTCAVVVEEDSLETIGILLYTEDDREKAQIWVVRDGMLVLRLLADGVDSTTYQYPVPALPIAEMGADVLITEPVRREQKRANFAESMLTRLMEVAGFPERYTTNAQKEGVWEQVPDEGDLGNLQLAHLETKEVNGVTYYKVPRPRTLGSSILTELVGLPVYDANGQLTGFTDPGIQIFPPTDPEFAIKSANHARAAILKDCHQAHVLGAENLQRSGISITQARADFTDDATNAKAPLEGMLRDVVTAVIAWASAMSNEFAGFLTRYRVVVNVRVNPGPLSPEERAQNAADVAAGLMSDETAMLAAGIEDVAAERARIAASPLGALAQAEKQAVVLRAWLDADAPLPFAAEKAGLDEEEAAKLVNRAEIVVTQ